MCPQCGVAVTADMRFCGSCGFPLGTQGAQPAETTQIDVPPATAAYPPVPMPAPSSLQLDMQSGTQSDPQANDCKNRKKPIIIAIIVIIAVIALIAGFVVWKSTNRNSGDDSAQNGSSTAQNADEQSNKTKQNDAAKQTKDCATTPDAGLESVEKNGTTMIATVAFSAHACGDTAWKGEDVTTSIKDSSNEVIASAVYDFASDPMQFTSGTATLELAYAIGQYWRASDQIETKSTSMVVQKGATPNGNAVASVGDARGGANIADSDAERYAQLALSWQLSRDRSAVSGLYDIPTTQLFSRKYGMEVDGKTQQYRDIYAQYLTLRASWPKAVLAWAADYSYYTRYGHEADYYVLLSGEEFGSVADARAWCSDNGFGENDCMAVQIN
ncbi:MAG: zinc-ribbon domain-containing protein [Bifidobacterium pseudocatenulatum]